MKKTQVPSSYSALNPEFFFIYTIPHIHQYKKQKNYGDIEGYAAVKCMALSALVLIAVHYSALHCSEVLFNAVQFFAAHCSVV
jgi:hypothetical protein